MLLAKKYLTDNYELNFTSKWQLTEISLGLLIIILLLFLMVDAGQYRKAVRNYACPNSVQYKTSKHEGKFETNSNFSIGYQEYQERRKLRPRTLSKLSWTTEERNKFVDVINGRLKLLKGSPEREKYVDQLLALTPSQFVRLDREEQKRKAACALSLTTLYLNVKEKRFSDAELLKQIEAAKEDCQCSIYAHEIMNYCKAENITDSLIDLLQEFIDNTGPDNPPPLNGELTSLLYDAGDLSTQDRKSVV